MRTVRARLSEMGSDRCRKREGVVSVLRYIEIQRKRAAQFGAVGPFGHFLREALRKRIQVVRLRGHVERGRFDNAEYAHFGISVVFNIGRTILVEESGDAPAQDVTIFRWDEQKQRLLRLSVRERIFVCDCCFGKQNIVWGV